VEGAAIAQLDGFLPTGDSDLDLLQLQVDSSIRDFRNAVEADVVSVVLRKTDTGVGGLVPFCGFAIVQRPGCSDPGQPPLAGCGLREAFNDFAYHFTAVNCMRSALMFPHELGHNLGGEHDRNPAYSVEDHEASYPFSFGYWFSQPGVGHFQTVMGRALGNSARDFYFATPRIIHPLHGVPVGVVAMNDVVLTIEQLSTTMEGFRGAKSPVVFHDNFDSGTLAVWSAIVSGL
jgi:hypothetical protein